MVRVALGRVSSSLLISRGGRGVKDFVGRVASQDRSYCISVKRLDRGFVESASSVVVDFLSVLEENGLKFARRVFLLRVFVAWIEALVGCCQILLRK